MTRYFLLFFSFLFACFFKINAQRLEILDSETNFPVSDVLIYNNEMSISILSNEHGIAPLLQFSENDKIWIRHPAYEIHLLTSPPFSDTTIMLIKKQIELPEVIVAASKEIEETNQVPRKIVSITASDINFTTPQSTASVLENSEQIFVQRSQMGGGSPMIRGFSANRILLTFDGVRMNNAIARGGNLHSIISADPFFMERVEIIYGPGTVNYGSDALGGVVSMHSKEIYTGMEKADVRGSAQLNYSSANQGKMAHVDVGVGKRKWGWYTSISLSDFGNMLMGSNSLSEQYERPEYVVNTEGLDEVRLNENKFLQNPSAFQQTSISQKFKFNLDRNSDLELSALYNTTTNIPRYDRLQEKDDDGAFKYGEWYYGPQNWLLTRLNYTLRKRNAFFDRSRILLSYQNWRESRIDRRFQDAWLNERRENVHVGGVEANFSKKVNEHTGLRYGISSYYNSVQSLSKSSHIQNGAARAINTRYPDDGSVLWLNGIYAAFKQALTEKAHLNLGARYTFQHLSTQFSDTSLYNLSFNKLTLNTQAFTGSIGMNYSPVRRVLVKSNLTSGFRAPNVDDVSKIFDSEPGSLVIPNPELRPEYAYNAEIGLEISDSSKFQIELSAFYTHLEGAIVRDEYSLNGMDSILHEGELKNVQALVNKDYAQIYGVNAGLQLLLLKDLKLKLNYSITRGMDNENNPLRHVSPDFGACHLIYQLKKIKADFFVRYNAQFGNNRLSLSEQGKTHIYALNSAGLPYVPSFFTMNFLIQYRYNKNLVLNAGVENIGDVGYRPYSSGISAPGINFKVGIKTDF